MGKLGLATQLRIDAMDKASAYSAGEQRWQHGTEIGASELVRYASESASSRADLHPSA